LGGYSFGAVTAFEMAHELRRDGEEVALLFMLDPPGKTRELSPLVGDRFQRQMRELALLGFREKLNSLLQRGRAIVRNQFTARTAGISRSLKRLQWQACLLRGRHLPPSLRSGYILDVYRQALRSYVPQRYAGRVAIVKAGKASYRPTMDWKELVAGQLEIYEVRGSHTDLMKEPYVAVWAARLKDSLDGAASREVLWTPDVPAERAEDFSSSKRSPCLQR
jgi:thioesterase domain-containing protein